MLMKSLIKNMLIINFFKTIFQASDILAEDISYWQSILLKERYEQLKKDEISVNFVRFCVLILYYFNKRLIHFMLQ